MGHIYYGSNTAAIFIHWTIYIAIRLAPSGDSICLVLGDSPEAIYLRTNLQTTIIFDGKAGTDTLYQYNTWNNASFGPKMILRKWQSVLLIT